jgi:cobalt-zinc-cadmium efflux system membrane fusion protein
MKKTVLILSSLVWLACGGKETPADAAPALKSDAKGVTLSADAPQWKYVEVAVAQELAALPPLPAPGHVDIDEKRTSNVGTPLAGRIEDVQVRLGDHVTRGDRLFSVRSGAWSDLDRELESSRAAVEVKKHIVERLHDLLALKAVAEKDSIAAEAELKEAELTLRAAEAKRRSFSVSTGGDNLFWVNAPRTGTVVELDAYSSQEVTPDRDKPLLRISDLDEVLVLADVPENDVVDLKVGASAKIKTQVGNVERDAVIDHISEVMDPRRRTIEVRLRVINKDRALRPNSFVEVTPTVEPGVNRVRVPASATVSEGANTVVFIVTEPGRLEPRNVLPGRRRNGEVELRSGLAPGTRFVARGALLLLNQVTLSK